MAQQVPAPQAEEQRREQLRQLLSNRLPQEEMAALLSTDVDLLLAQNLVTDSRIRGASKEDLVHAGFTIGTAVALKNAFPDPHGAAASAPPAAAAATVPVCVTVEPPDQKVEDAFQRVSRLRDQYGNTIGACVRLNGGIVLAARHCVVSEGRCLPKLQAFGGQLEFLAGRPDVDLVAFRGPEGPSFTVSVISGMAQVGVPVHLLSFPLTYDKELKLSGTSGPALDSGVISQVSETGQYALATFSTGMPNRSGGAVVSSTRMLAGLYTGTVWYLEEAPSSSSSGSSGRSSNSGSGGSGGSGEPPAELSRNPTAMWDDPVGEADALEEAAGDDHRAAQLSLVNIKHKTSAGLFVPAAALLQFLKAAGLTAADPVDAAGNRNARRRVRPCHQ